MTAKSKRITIYYTAAIILTCMGAAAGFYYELTLMKFLTYIHGLDLPKIYPPDIHQKIMATLSEADRIKATIIGAMLGLFLYGIGWYSFYVYEAIKGKRPAVQLSPTTFPLFLLMLLFMPLILVLGLLVYVYKLIKWGTVPALLTAFCWYLHPTAGIVMGSLSAIFVAVQFYNFFTDEPERASAQEILNRKRAEMEIEARRIHGDAQFLSDENLLGKGYFKAFGNIAAPLLGIKGIKLPPEAQINMTEGKGKKAKTVTIDHLDGFVHYPNSAHLLTFAATGAGKGRGTLVPNLLEHDGSVLVIDPKGENAAITARHRKSLQPTFILDPWGVSGHESHSFNPLSRITEDNPDYIADAASIAEAMVKGRQGGDPHWDESAKGLLTGLILYVAFEEEAEDRHLLRMREWLTVSQDAFRKLLTDNMQPSTKADGLIQRTGARFAGTPEKEFGSILSTALRHTQFLETAPAPMRKVLVNTDFDLRDLKSDEGLSLYLCLPPNRLSTHSRWLRLMVNMAISAMAEVQKKPEKPVFFMLDEASILGHMKSISDSMGLMRGYGMQLWTIWQDLPQLKTAYKDEWQSFLANAGAIQVFGINDQETAEYFSKQAGEHGIVKTGVSAGEGQNFAQHGGTNANQGGNLSIEKRRLVTVDELMRLDSDIVVCFLQGEHPVACRKSFYDQIPIYNGKYDKNPYL